MPTAAPKLVYTAEAESQAGAYVFSHGNETGFIVLSADDCAPALLGYSDHGNFDVSEMPDNMKAWLDEYARQIAWASANGHNQALRSTAVKQRPEVQPKITTRWNQDNPYWLKCPVSEGRYCYSGCVATAMAQIMNWHQWPEQPVGTVSYTCRGIGTLSLDFSTIRFEWDKMLDTYTSQSPAENKEAVATLMQACGYGAQMYYSPSGSGAASYVAGMAMIKHFGYDQSLSLQQRQWYGIEEWDDLVYDELTTYGPVYYDGTGTGGGHAFVCDGYSAADGLFHFNWGWGGLSDGYFRLSALNPGEQGAGGVSPGYNWDQSIMRGLRKAQPDSKPTYVFAPYAGLRSPMTDYDNLVLGNYFTMLGYETTDGFCNYSLADLEHVAFGAQFKNVITGELIHRISDNYPDETMNAYTRRINILVQLPVDLPDGNYEVRPVVRVGEDGQWINMKENQAFRNHIDMKVEDGKVDMSITQAKAKINVDNIVTPEYFTSSSPFTIENSVNNIGTADFIGQIRAVFVTYTDGKINIEAQGEVHEVVVPAGQSVNVSYTSPIVWGKLNDGEYYLCFGNAVTGEIVSDFYEANVGNRYGQLKMSYYEFDIASKDFVNRDMMQISAQLTCSEGTYNGPIALLISSSRKNFIPEWAILSQENYEMIAVETKSIEFTGRFREGEIGSTYYAMLGYPDGSGGYTLMATNPLTFTVGETSAITECESDSDLSISYDPATLSVSAQSTVPVTYISVISASGTIVASGDGFVLRLPALPRGIYMAKAIDASGRSAATKIIMK